MYPEDRIWNSKSGLIEEGSIFLTCSSSIIFCGICSAIAQENKLKNVAITRLMTKTTERSILVR